MSKEKKEPTKVVRPGGARRAKGERLEEAGVQSQRVEGEPMPGTGRTGMVDMQEVMAGKAETTEVKEWSNMVGKSIAQPWEARAPEPKAEDQVAEPDDDEPVTKVGSIEVPLESLELSAEDAKPEGATSTSLVFVASEAVVELEKGGPDDRPENHTFQDAGPGAAQPGRLYRERIPKGPIPPKPPRHPAPRPAPKSEVELDVVGIRNFWQRPRFVVGVFLVMALVAGVLTAFVIRGYQRSNGDSVLVESVLPDPPLVAPSPPNDKASDLETKIEVVPTQRADTVRTQPAKARPPVKKVLPKKQRPKIKRRARTKAKAKPKPARKVRRQKRKKTKKCPRWPGDDILLCCDDVSKGISDLKVRAQVYRGCVKQTEEKGR